MIPLEALSYIEWLDDSGQARRLRSNVQVSESIEMPSEVTEHPVEAGVNITDHVRLQPNVLQVELFFTDAMTRTDIDPRFDLEEQEISAPDAPFDLRTLTSTSGLLLTALSAFTPKQKYTIQSYSKPDKPRLQEAFELIEELREKGRLVTAKTKVKLLENMAIEMATLSRTKESGDGGTITLSLKQIRFVKSDITLVLPVPKDARAQAKKDAGKGTKTVDEPKKSALKKASDAAGFTTPGSGI